MEKAKLIGLAFLCMGLWGVGPIFLRFIYKIDPSVIQVMFGLLLVLASLTYQCSLFKPPEIAALYFDLVSDRQNLFVLGYLLTYVVAGYCYVWLIVSLKDGGGSSSSSASNASGNDNATNFIIVSVIATNYNVITMILTFLLNSTTLNLKFGIPGIICSVVGTVLMAFA